MSIVLDGTAGITTPQVTTDDGEAYAPGNILGTVSQSSGVPTGAIIQRGSNANGEFVRYADGTQICTATRTDLVSTGGVGRVSPVDFPVSFSDTSRVVAVFCKYPDTPGGSTDNLERIWYAENTVFRSNTVQRTSLQLHARTLSDNNFVSETHPIVMITVIGRWF